MKKILINIYNDSLIFSYKETTEAQVNLTKTNIINDSELLFTTKYIEENEKLIFLFIKEICQDKKIYRATFETNELALFFMDLLRKNSHITALCIREDSMLSYPLYEKIMENKNINYIECESIPEYMIEMLDAKGIHSESRSEVFYPSYFMQNNNLTNFSKIFYQMNIRIEEILNEEDKEDFNAFCRINKYLKTIHLDIYNKNDLETILNILIQNRMKNIRILIYQNIKDYKTIEYLKKLNKKIKKKKLKIELVYSKEYLSNNIFIQMMMNTLKIIGIILVVLVIGIISYIAISNYIALQEVSSIQENLKETIKENENTEIVDPIDSTRVIKNNYIASILTINPDVVGWLRVNNTNVDYPVVQAEDNDYYLKHNLYNENDKNGWIFMDYRNNNYELDTNTIIFGHNMYYSGVMFGTLADAYKKNWYNDPNNLTISFDTIYESNEYEIFSIYKVPKTNDYLKTYFASDEEFNEFVSLIKGRSVKDFGVELKPGDKILTLSTCSNHTERLVIHAKLKA